MDLRTIRKQQLQHRVWDGQQEVTVGAPFWDVEVKDRESGRRLSLQFATDPTDADIHDAAKAQLADEDGAKVDPGPSGGRRTIFNAAAEAAMEWDALDRLNTVIQATGTAKQKTGAQALADRAYNRAKRLAADYADAVNE